MAKSYYSTVLDHTAEEVWAVIRPFDHYAWAGVLCDPPPFPVRNYGATIRVARIVDGDKAFVEWWKTIDCTAEEHAVDQPFQEGGFCERLAALRPFTESRSPGAFPLPSPSNLA